MKGNSRGTLAGLTGNARSVLVFMCAGVPTGRGIPDYRGPSGLWKTKSPVDARSSWALPRQGVELEKTGSLLMLVTRNIDGLHVKAGIRNP